MFVCMCFGVTEDEVRRHAVDGASTPRQVASACKAGTDCGSCVRRIQALLGRGACSRRELSGQGRPVPAAGPVPAAESGSAQDPGRVAVLEATPDAGPVTSDAAHSCPRAGSDPAPGCDVVPSGDDVLLDRAA